MQIGVVASTLDRIEHGHDCKLSVAIGLDQGRPAAGPAREALNEGALAFRIGRSRDQGRIERPSVGKARTRPRTALGGRVGNGMEDEAVRALDG